MSTFSVISIGLGTWVSPAHQPPQVKILPNAFVPYRTQYDIHACMHTHIQYYCTYSSLQRMHAHTQCTYCIYTRIHRQSLLYTSNTYTPSIHACTRIHRRCTMKTRHDACVQRLYTLTLTSWNVVPVGRVALSIHHTLHNGHAPRQREPIIACYVGCFVDGHTTRWHCLTISDG